MKAATALVSVFTRPTWPLVFFATFLIAFGTVAVGTLVNENGAWRSKVVRYESWHKTDQPARCKRWETECARVLGKDHTNDTSQIANRYELAVQSVLCEGHFKRQPDLECISVRPGTLPTHLAEIDIGRRIGEPGLALWLALLLPMSVMRIVLNERHRGWRRLSLLIGGLAAPIAGMIAYLIDDQLGFIVVTAIGGLLCGLILPIFVKRAMLWVKAGFSPEADLPTQPASISAGDSGQPELPWHLSAMTALKILGAVAALAASVGVFVYGSDQAISTLVSSITQVVVVVGIVGLIRWVYGLFTHDKK